MTGHKQGEQKMNFDVASQAGSGKYLDTNI